MNKVKCVFFDVGGVLAKWDGQMYRDIQKELTLDDKQVESFRQNYMFPFGRGEISETELWVKAAKEMGIRDVSVEEDLIGRAFAKSFQRYEEVIKYAHHLNEMGVRAAILSNTNAVHSEINNHNNVYDGFKDVFLSHEIGLRKPNPKIYLYVLDKLKLKPEETILVDDWEENIEAASKVGIKTVLAKNSSQTIRDIDKLLQ